ncbi:MAG TPA: hypothetical protein VIH59_18120, partial [Candidatus Tectomicrobia bacterium]
MRRLKTSVSVAHWCIPSAEGKYEIGEARIPSMTQPGEELGFFSWLDQLLEGGIVIPKSPTGKQHALTILFTGPPGTGKSVLAMELCYRW